MNSYYFFKKDLLFLKYTHIKCFFFLLKLGYKTLQKKNCSLIRYFRIANYFIKDVLVNWFGNSI